MRITIVASPVLAPALPGLFREFERAVGHTVTAAYATAGAMAQRLNDAGGDVAASTKAAIGELQAQGRVFSSGGRDIARVGLGVQMRKGAPTPFIGTAEAFRSVLLAARSVGYIDPAEGGAAGAHAARVMTRLGIAQSLAGKTQFEGGTALTTAIVEGEIELGLAPISEIVSDPRVQLVGPIPPELQEVTVVTAAVTTWSSVPDAAQTLVDFLAGPASAAELASHGLK